MPTETNCIRNLSDLANTWWGDQAEIGHAYLDMAESFASGYRETSTEERGAWFSLAHESEAGAFAFSMLYDVERTDVSEPYPSASVMVQSMRETGTLHVSEAHCEHPIWSVDQNVDFRTVHDGFGHAISGGAFSWRGELDACSVHFRMVRNPLARRALFTECIGQIAAYYVNGKQHADQVCGFLPERFTKGFIH